MGLISWRYGGFDGCGGAGAGVDPGTGWAAEGEWTCGGER